MSLGGGGGGEIPKGGRAGRARSLGIWPRGGGEITGGEIPGTPECKHFRLKIRIEVTALYESREGPFQLQSSELLLQVTTSEFRVTTSWNNSAL